MWGINCWMTCHCTETQISCRNIGLLIKKTSLIRDSTSVRAVWSFAGHRSQSARVPWREVAGIRNPPSPPSDHEEKKLHWSCLELPHLPLVLWGFSCQHQLRCWSQSCAAVNRGTAGGYCNWGSHGFKYNQFMVWYNPYLNFQSRLQIIPAPFPRFVLKGINYKEENCI